MLPPPLPPQLLIAWLAAITSIAPSVAQLDFDILGELYPEDFFQAPKASQFALSPSGSKYAYAYSDLQKNVLYVADVGSADKEAYAGRNPSEAQIQFIGWNSEDRIVFQTTDGDIFSLDLETGKRHLMFDGSRTVRFFNAIFWGNFSLPRIISMLPEDESHILVSAFNEKGNRVVYKTPLFDGDPRDPPIHIKPAFGITSWHADHEGQVRLGIKTTPNRQTFYYKAPESKLWIPLRQLFNNDSDINLDLSKSNFIGRRDYFAGFAFDQNTIYLASNKKTDTMSLYAYDLEARDIVETLANDAEYDFFDLSLPSISLWFSKSRRKLVGLPYHRDKPTVAWFDDYFRETQSRVDGQLPDSSNFIAQWNDDETRFVVVSVRSDKPTEYWIYDGDSDELHPIGSRSETLASAELAKSKPIELKSRDGLALHGYLTMAESESGDLPPLVMLPHGGPWARDYFGYDPAVQWLVYNGYSVLQINYRGSTGYGYGHYIASRKDFGWGIQNDIEDAANWAVENGHASAGNLAIMGFSYGGYAALLALANQPGKYKCGVAMAGIYNLLKVSKNLRTDSYSKLSYAHFKEMVGRDWGDRKALREISPFFLAKNVADPVLLVHGELDDIASYSQSEDMHAALEKSGKASKFITVEDEGHGFYLPKNQIKVYASAVDFLDSHFNKD